MEKDLSTNDELRKPRGKPQDIGSVIQRFVSDCDMALKLKKYSIFNHWEEIVGAGISSRTKPEKISRTMLYISVTNSTWANELSMMSGQLLQKINSYIGEDVIKELRFKVK
jgi:Zn-ribbon-containing, possibly RNA-binding protein and truncated derivatives